MAGKLKSTELGIYEKKIGGKRWKTKGENDETVDENGQKTKGKR